MKRQNVRTLSLIVCTFTYLLVGAAVFDALESDNELQQRALVARVRSRLMTKYNMTEADYEVLEATIIKSIPHKAGFQWKFSGAFYFATTVITTIGYGHSTPMTTGGKVFCMFYALAGIPLGLVMFQSIGERINTFAAKIVRWVKRTARRDDKVTSGDLIKVASLLGFIIIVVGTLAFAKYENWSYLNSFYYSFTTLTTIGFGDFVALQKGGALQSQPEYVVFSLIFILLGLTVISAAMNLLVLRFLTMNTEDEKRDEQQAELARKGLFEVRNNSDDMDETDPYALPIADNISVYPFQLKKIWMDLGLFLFVLSPSLWKKTVEYTAKSLESAEEWCGTVAIVDRSATGFCLSPPAYHLHFVIFAQWSLVNNFIIKQ